MGEQGKSKKRRPAVLAMLVSQMRRSPELTRLMILLLVWGHVRSRGGYNTMNERPIRRGHSRKRGQRRKSFSLKRPRERFL
jgi:hypothetical protein